MEGFEYVIQRPPQARVCFGSGVQRETVPLCGPARTPLMRRRQPEQLGENLAPGHYELTYDPAIPETHPGVRRRGVSKRGFGPLAGTTIRFNFEEVSNSPGVGDYELVRKPAIKASAKPFGSGVPDRMPQNQSQITPGVGTYRFKARKDIRSHSFGGTIKITPATRTFCKPDNFDRCQRCDERPEVDYWKNLRTERCLCRRCMVRELNEARPGAVAMKQKTAQKKQLDALKEFKRVRHCSYYHRHDKTNAAIQFVSNKQLKRKFRLENYLSAFEE
ncbi:uncharacterized protein LOC126577370 [Anopheles aquasalis]|uniref:uncharacterized protein LOC126577370 n=1 Tax=Anopheles aquasalis TaxID=42839 RepID=UPI00215AC10D|nr:uncharacterized protein LOC126577370 [Anopheles aquasalis]